MLRPTLRALGVAVAVLTFSVVGIMARIPEFLGVAVAGAVLIGIAVAMTLGGGAVTGTRHAPARVERDSESAVTISLRADTRHRIGLRVASIGRGRSGRGNASTVPVLWGATGPIAQVPIPTRRRGPRVLGPWTVERVDPWGLFIRRLGDIDPIEVLVTPRIRRSGIAALPLTINERSGADEAGTLTFASLREYVVGDEPRHVHWRSTAKTGTLMTRQYIDITRPRLVIVLVDDTTSYRSAPVKVRARHAMADPDFEAAVDLAASVANLAATAGMDVDVVTTSGGRAVAGRSPGWWDLLSRVDMVDQTSPHARLLRLPRATTVVVAGHQTSGWWERIPARAVLRP